VRGRTFASLLQEGMKAKQQAAIDLGSRRMEAKQTQLRLPSTSGSRKERNEAMTTSSHRPRAGSRSFRYVYKPSRKARSVYRRSLVEYLIDEIKHGSGLTGLYAGMLLKTLLAEEEELRRIYPQFAGEPDNKPSKAREPSEAREARPKRTEPSIPRLRLDHPRR
jgi:hypothetical protein